MLLFVFAYGFAVSLFAIVFALFIEIVRKFKMNALIALFYVKRFYVSIKQNLYICLNGMKYLHIFMLKTFMSGCTIFEYIINLIILPVLNIKL